MATPLRLAVDLEDRGSPRAFVMLSGAPFWFQPDSRRELYTWATCLRAMPARDVTWHRCMSAPVWQPELSLGRPAWRDLRAARLRRA